MLDEDTRTAILRLHTQGHGSRKICRALGIARDSVRRIIRSGSADVPPLLRAERAEPWREQILELYARYEGHLGRVHDALTALGAAVSYPALTAFCRRHGIGHTPPPPAGHDVPKTLDHSGVKAQINQIQLSPNSTSKITAATAAPAKIADQRTARDCGGPVRAGIRCEAMVV